MDKLYSSAGGILCSVMGMTTGVIGISNVAEALLLGIVGGFAGLISKTLWDVVVNQIKKRSK